MKSIYLLVKRYWAFLIILLVNLAILLFRPETGMQSFRITWDNILEMLSVIPPIFILIGLLDVWVKRETMMKHLGDNSGMIGVVIAFILGSVASGPLYAAFPVAGVLLAKGCKLSNVFIFIGAWSTTKIPLLLFEASALGTRFTLIRLALSIVGIVVIAAVTECALSASAKKMIYEAAENRSQTMR